MRLATRKKIAFLITLTVYGIVGTILNVLKRTVSRSDPKFVQMTGFPGVIPDPTFFNKYECSHLTKHILWYDVYYNGTGVRNRAKPVDFSKCKCRCDLDFFILNDSSRPYGPFGADAVLMQLNRLERIRCPPLRRLGQVFVMVEREPRTTRLRLKIFENIFNWTMTYRRDSDIFYPYGKIVERTEKLPEKNYSEIYRRKKKGIVWFVSHCKTNSQREKYIEELNKYIEVDIVGKCGRLRCPKHGKEAKKCLPKFEEDYFFRFAFENTYLKEYVTEKLFDTFSTNIVQIVGGSADYNQIVPSHTVIDAKDFKSPKSLAIYLKLLMASEDRYTAYLKTKDKYYAETRKDRSQKAYCQLCSMLHNQDKYQKSYKNISDWWLN